MSWAERLVVRVNRRPFGRAEAAFYETVAAGAVARIVAPVLEEQLRTAPAGVVLDVGCGGGVLAHHLARSDRPLVGIDPSVVQLRRLRRHGPLPCAAAPAGALPFATGSIAAAFSSCTVKHWPDRLAGIEECARVLRPGGLLVVVEIDGGQDPAELARFASHTRIPPGLRRLYPGFARRSFVPVSPTAEEVVADCSTAGLREVRHWRIHGLPFLVVTALR